MFDDLTFESYFITPHIFHIEDLQCPDDALRFMLTDVALAMVMVSLLGVKDEEVC